MDPRKRVWNPPPVLGSGDWSTPSSRDRCHQSAGSDQEQARSGLSSQDSSWLVRVFLRFASSRENARFYLEESDGVVWPWRILGSCSVDSYTPLQKAPSSHPCTNLKLETSRAGRARDLNPQPDVRLRKPDKGKPPKHKPIFLKNSILKNKMKFDAGSRLDGSRRYSVKKKSTHWRALQTIPEKSTPTYNQRGSCWWWVSGALHRFQELEDTWSSQFYCVHKSLALNAVNITVR